MVERTPTGIPGLDEITEGGFPRGSSVLIAGVAGTCKSIFCMQYIYNGVDQYGEPGLYVTLEEHVKNIAWNVQSFGWDIHKYQENKLLNIYRMNLGAEGTIKDQIKDELETIGSIVKEQGISRLVIDSTSAMTVWMNNRGQIRNLLFNFVDKLKDLDCTTLLTTQAKAGKNSMSAYEVEEYVVDGVISLYFNPPFRYLLVRKMRGTNHDKNIHPFELSGEGLKVKNKETVLWEALK